jgi:manganese/zinc/iron transport system substrate-binding protein
MSRRTRFVIHWILAVAVLAGGCRAEEGTAGDIAERKVQVVATTSILADLASRVGGERVEVIALMGPGVDPHLYRASEGDVRRMGRADLIVYNGLHLEGRMSELLDEVGRRGRATVAAAEGVPAEKLLRPPEFEGAYDPHVWMDVSLWRDAARHVSAALAAIDPAHSDHYAARLLEYDAGLAALNGYVVDRISRLPEERRVLVTAHDAFNYFGRAYGFEVRGLQGISTVAEAGTADVQDVARFVADRRIPAIFVETSVSPRSIQAVRAAVRARGVEVAMGGDLYSDALGGAGSGADSYEGMIRHNVDTIVGALSRGE